MSEECIRPAQDETSQKHSELSEAQDLAERQRMLEDQKIRTLEQEMRDKLNMDDFEIQVTKFD